MNSSVKTWGSPPRKDPGVSSPVMIGPTPEVESLEARLGRGVTLQDLADEFTFFHHGLLQQIHWDPVPVFYAENGISPKRMPRKVYGNCRILAGLPEPEGRYIYIVNKDIWVGLAAFFDAASPTRSAHLLYFNVFRQVIPIPDILYLCQRPDTPGEKVPMVDLNVCALDGNMALHYWRKSANTIGLPLELCKAKPNPTTVRFASALFGLDKDPFGKAKQRD